MSIKQTGYGTWQARWRDANGNQRAKSFRTESLARSHERQMRADAERGLRPKKRERLTVNAWSKRWLAGAHNLTPGARQLYQEDLDLHILPALGDHEMAALEDDHTPIDDFLADELAAGRAPSSVHRYWRTLRRMLNVAVKRSVIARSPMVDVEPPRVPLEEMRYLDATGLERLAGAANGARLYPEADPTPGWDYGPLILTAGWGGLRWGECAGLRRKWVDRARSGVYVAEQWTGDRFDDTKGGNRRFVRLPASVLDDLRSDGDPNGLVFTSPQGGHLVHSNWRQRVWVPAKKAAAVDAEFRFHDLRHTAVALAIRADSHPEAIKRRLGWSTIALMDSYGHLFPDMDEALGDRLEQMRSDASKPNLRAV